jgi:hypothetical protein
MLLFLYTIMCDFGIIDPRCLRLGGKVLTGSKLPLYEIVKFLLHCYQNTVRSQFSDKSLLPEIVYQFQFVMLIPVRDQCLLKRMDSAYLMDTILDDYRLL